MLAILFVGLLSRLEEFVYY